MHGRRGFGLGIAAAAVVLAAVLWVWVPRLTAASPVRQVSAPAPSCSTLIDGGWHSPAEHRRFDDCYATLTAQLVSSGQLQEVYPLSGAVGGRAFRCDVQLPVIRVRCRWLS